MPPRMERPNFEPGYGIPDDPPQSAPWETVEEKLRAARNYWIGSTRANGAPHAAPVWGLWADGALWFGTDDRSVKGRNLARDPRVVAHLESGDDTVILEGAVERVAAGAFPRAHLEAYCAKYAMPVHQSPEDATWLRLRPQVAFTWLEQDFLKTAARWVFED